MNMKNISVTIALAALLSAATCAFAAESVPATVEVQEKTVEKSSTSSGMTEVQVKIMEEGLATSESTFRQLYRQVWSELKLGEKVKSVVSKVMDAQIEEMMWGTQRARLSYNIGDVIGKIVKNSVATMQPDLDAFAVELSKKYNDAYPGDAVHFFKNLAADGVVSSDNQKVKAFVKLATADLLANDGAALKEKIASVLPEGVKISAAFEAKPKVAVPEGFKGFKDSTLKFIDIFVSVKEGVENDVTDAITDYFIKEAPVVMWEASLIDIRRGFMALYDEISTMLKEADVELQ